MGGRAGFQEGPPRPRWVQRTQLWDGSTGALDKGASLLHTVLHTRSPPCSCSRARQVQGVPGPDPDPAPARLPRPFPVCPAGHSSGPNSTDPTQAAPAPCLTPDSGLPPLPEPKDGPNHRWGDRLGRGQQTQPPPRAPLQLLLEASGRKGGLGRRSIDAEPWPPWGSWQHSSHKGAAGPLLLSQTPSGFPRGPGLLASSLCSQDQSEVGTPTRMPTACLSRVQSPQDNRGSNR